MNECIVNEFTLCEMERNFDIVKSIVEMGLRILSTILESWPLPQSTLPSP